MNEYTIKIRETKRGFQVVGGTNSVNRQSSNAQIAAHILTIAAWVMKYSADEKPKEFKANAWHKVFSGNI